jgi:hypothetical protein
MGRWDISPTIASNTALVSSAVVPFKDVGADGRCLVSKMLREVGLRILIAASRSSPWNVLKCWRHTSMRSSGARFLTPLIDIDKNGKI